ncbi:hypothetical protein HN51_050305 [Arachis hypogaea]
MQREKPQVHKDRKNRGTLKSHITWEEERELVVAGLEKVTMLLWGKTCAYLTRGDRSIGFVSVYPWSGDDRCKADIGYAVAADYWGQGIATKAVKMAVPQVFNDLSYLVRLQAFTSPENKASQRALEKAGFLKEGLLRKYTYFKGNIKDSVVFSFLSTDEFPHDD